MQINNDTALWIALFILLVIVLAVWEGVKIHRLNRLLKHYQVDFRVEHHTDAIERDIRDAEDEYRHRQKLTGSQFLEEVRKAKDEYDSLYPDPDLLQSPSPQNWWEN